MPIPENPRINYVILASGYKWNPEFTNQQHRDELMEYFRPDPNVTKSVIRNVLEDCFDHKPDRFLRTPEERAKAQELTQKMQTFFASRIADRAEASYKFIENHPEKREIFIRLSRSAQFALHLGPSDEAREFNERLITATLQYKDNPDPLRKILLDEVNKLREDLGLNDPENVRKLHVASDAELVELYPKYDRYIHLLAELAEGGGKNLFTPEQHEELMKQQDVFSLNTTLEHRINMIANPYYAEINTELVFAQNLTASVAQRAIRDHLDLADNADLQNHFGVLFSEAKSLHDIGPISLLYSLPIVNPALAGAFQNEAEIGPFLMVDIPVIALGNDGEQYVITNKMIPGKIPTVQEYGEELLNAATKADKWLLTGSKQFDLMMQAQRALNEARDAGANAEQLKELAENLEKAATDYLVYKDPDFTAYTGPASVQGKNMREQSRLEAAGNILNSAKALVAVMPKVIEAEQKAAEAAKAEQNKKTAPFLKNRANIQFLNELPVSTQAALSRQTPTINVKEKTQIDEMQLDRNVAKPLMPQDQFSALCALACGSGDVHTTSIRTKRVDGQPQFTYETVKKMVGGKEIVTQEKVPVKERVENRNPNPAGTFETAMKAILEGQKVIKDLKNDDPLKVMITAAQSNVFYAVKNGDYDALGKMVADGLKRNNDFMKDQKGFSSKFCAGANLIEQAMKAMDGNRALKDTVEKYLPANELQTAKALQTLNNLYAESLQAQSRALTHLATPGRSLDDPAFIKDVARICNMYGTSKAFANKKVDLTAIDPATYSQKVEADINALAENSMVRDYINGLNGKSIEEKLNAVGMSSNMSRLHKEITEQQDLQANQNQPKPELQMNIVNQVQQQPQSVSLPQ